MATLGDLKERIISETTRDDLADDLASQFTNIINKSIDQWANEAWAFNEKRILTPTVAGLNSVTLPPGTRRIDDLYLEQTFYSRYRLYLRSLDEMAILAQGAPTGPPSDYALRDTTVLLHPTPDRVYSLAWHVIADVTPPLVADTDQNAWTNQGQDLITATAKKRLYRDYLSATSTDPRVLTARDQENEAYSRLRAESNRRLATGRVRPGW